MCWRAIIATFVALAAPACTVGLPSAVEAVPFAVRMTAPPFADGIYCAIELREDSTPVVRTGDEESDSNCIALTWSDADRSFTIRETDDDGEQKILALADLGGGLLLMQFPASDEQTADKPYAYLLWGAVARGGAIAVLPLPSDGRVAERAAHYPGVKISIHKSAGPMTVAPAPSVEGEATESVPVPNPDVFYVSSGSPADVRALARDLAIEGITYIGAEAANKGVPFWHGVPMFVRDAPGSADHPLSSSQERDVEETITILRRAADP